MIRLSTIIVLTAWASTCSGLCRMVELTYAFPAAAVEGAVQSQQKPDRSMDGRTVKRRASSATGGFV